MKFEIPIEVQVRAVASSKFTRETVERRLAELNGRDDTESRRERVYLERVLAEQFGE